MKISYALAVVLLITISGCSKPTPTGPLPPINIAPVEHHEPPPPPAAVIPGRYTIIHSPQVENDTMLLDTSTGRTWRLENSVADKELVWVEIIGQGH